MCLPKIKGLSIFLIGLTVMSCVNEQPKSKSDDKQEEAKSANLTQEKDQKKVIEKGGIILYPAKIAKEFPNAKLKMINPTEGDQLEAGLQQFDFEVKDYDLATQTPMADMRKCANSEKGQHIHFILNNDPYLAKYEPSFEAELDEGNNVVLAFLSRSYHESIKNETAFVLTNFQIGESSADFDLGGSHLFYSRPKGNYSKEDSKKILLDFFLVNTELSEEGNQVKATIDNETFLLSEWSPYFVEGLEEGKHQFRIELIDQSGKLVEGPFNDSGIREIIIE